MTRWLLHPSRSALLALLVYGGWAAASHWSYDLPIIVKAFFAQGLYAYLATLFVGSCALFGYRHLGKNALAIGCSFLACFTFLLITPVAIHRIVGTPEIFKSILPGLLWGSGYLLMLLITHHKKEHLA